MKYLVFMCLIAVVLAATKCPNTNVVFGDKADEKEARKADPALTLCKQYAESTCCIEPNVQVLKLELDQQEKVYGGALAYYWSLFTCQKCSPDYPDQTTKWKNGNCKKLCTSVYDDVSKQLKYSTFEYTGSGSKKTYFLYEGADAKPLTEYFKKAEDLFDTTSDAWKDKVDSSNLLTGLAMACTGYKDLKDDDCFAAGSYLFPSVAIMLAMLLFQWFR